jgi:signal transduction histidine kinase
VTGREAVRDDGQQVRPVGSSTLRPALPLGVSVGVVGAGFAAITVGRGWSVAAVWLPDLLVGFTFAAAGLVAWPRSRATGVLLAVAGLTWFAGHLDVAATFWHRGPLVHLLVTYPGWRPRSRPEGLAVLIGYVAALVPATWGDDATAVVLGVLLLGLVARSSVHAGAPVRRYRRAALVATVGLVVSLLAGVWTRSVGLAEVTAPVALLVYQVVLCLIAVGLVSVLRRSATPAVTDLVVELDPTRSGTLQDALGRVLHDPGLQVGYWHAPSGRYVDVEGLALNLPEPGPGAGRTTTLVSRAGERFAALVHDPAVLDDVALTEAVGTATRLTASHAMLQADLRAHVTKVEDSRRRLLLADDHQRRAFGHRLATGPVRRLEQLRADLAGLGPPRASRHVARALCHLDGSLADLAGIVDGLPPHELADGFEVALTALAERCPVPVQLRLADGRFPAEVEVTVWFTCAEALTNAAKHAAATSVSIAVERRAGGLAVEVVDDGRGGADVAAGTGLRGLTDRLEALGGRLVVVSELHRGTRVAATIPLPGTDRASAGRTS